MTISSERSEHRVSTHLGVEAATYDVQIRRFIPGYESAIAEVVAILDETLGEHPTVVDLGAGTGALAGAILDGIPRARVVLVDIDPNMLGVAGARVAAHGARAELRRASFEDALPPCNAVVASLALHHVPELDRKRALYASIGAALAPGGVFLNSDITVHESGAERARVYSVWEAWMGSAGIPRAEAQEHFAQWALEDRYYPLAVELALLADAGFARPECFWRQAALTVFGAFRAI